MVYTTLMTVKRKKIEPVTIPWIYHNPSLWLISLSSDGENWITLADKNLWATEIWNEWDEFTVANTWNCFQIWNNYPFPSPLDTSAQLNIYDWGIDTSSYSWQNPYSDDKFVIQDLWLPNDDLRWQVTDTNEARRWPCPEWFHVLSENDFEQIYWILSLISASIYKIKIWRFPFRNLDGYYDNSESYIASSKIDWQPYSVMIYPNKIFELYPADDSSNWLVVRPFKNEPVQPDSSRIILHQLN